MILLNIAIQGSNFSRLDVVEAHVYFSVFELGFAEIPALLNTLRATIIVVFAASTAKQHLVTVCDLAPLVLPPLVDDFLFVHLSIPLVYGSNRPARVKPDNMAAASGLCVTLLLFHQSPDVPESLLSLSNEAGLYYALYIPVSHNLL